MPESHTYAPRVECGPPGVTVQWHESRSRFGPGVAVGVRVAVTLPSGVTVGVNVSVGARVFVAVTVRSGVAVGVNVAVGPVGVTVAQLPDARQTADGTNTQSVRQSLLVEADEHDGDSPLH